jgi:hypothetical protein
MIGTISAACRRQKNDDALVVRDAWQNPRQFVVAPPNLPMPRDTVFGNPGILARTYGVYLRSNVSGYSLRVLRSSYVAAGLGQLGFCTRRNFVCVWSTTYVQQKEEFS